MAASQNDTLPTVTIKEICQRYSISPPTLYSRVRGGLFPLPHRIGTHPRWDERTLLRFDLFGMRPESDLSIAERNQIERAQSGKTCGPVRVGPAVIQAMQQLVKELNRLCAVFA